MSVCGRLFCLYFDLVQLSCRYLVDDGRSMQTEYEAKFLSDHAGVREMLRQL